MSYFSFTNGFFKGEFELKDKKFIPIKGKLFINGKKVLCTEGEFELIDEPQEVFKLIDCYGLINKYFYLKKGKRTFFTEKPIITQGEFEYSKEINKVFMKKGEKIYVGKKTFRGEFNFNKNCSYVILKQGEVFDLNLNTYRLKSFNKITDKSVIYTKFL